MFKNSLFANLSRSINKSMYSRLQKNCLLKNNQLINKRLVSNSTQKTLTRKIPHKIWKNLGALAIASAAGYTLYLDQTYTSRKDEAMEKRTMSEDDYTSLKRKTRKLEALMADGKLPTTIDFMVGDYKLVDTYKVDVLEVLDFFVNHDETGKFSSFLKTIMDQRKLTDIKELSNNLPAGLLSLMISRYIIDRADQIYLTNKEIESITITNAQYISLEELLKFEIDIAQVDQLILKKSDENLNESVVEYFDTVDKLKYL